MNPEENIEEDEEKKKEAEVSAQGTPDMQQQVPLSNDKFVPVQDGAVPMNSEGITQNQYDALNPIGQDKVAFQQGNFNQVVGYPKLVQDKVTVLTQTLVPLIEVSLIELLGSNQMYQRQSGECAMSFQNNQVQISFSFVYVVNGWVGTDIDQMAIQHDSQFVYNRIRPAGAAITKCEINTTDGTLVIQGNL
jgi:hypothetical protein